MKSGYTLYVCGTRGTHTANGPEFLEFGGQTTCYVLKSGTHAIVLDCGTGLFEARKLLADCDKIDVVLSHLHYDHIMGLAERVFPAGVHVNMYGEFDHWGGVATFENFMKPPFWPVTVENVTCVNVTNRVELNNEINLTLYPGNHPNYASIIRLDFGDVSFCAAIDYEHGEPFPRGAVEGCKWLIYDGMFTLAEYPEHEGWGHSTWEHGCEVAKEYGVEHLLIGHHAPTRTDDELWEMEMFAQDEFPGVRFARWREHFEL